MCLGDVWFGLANVHWCCLCDIVWRIESKVDFGFKVILITVCCTWRRVFCDSDYWHVCPYCRLVSQLACSSTGQRLSCPGTHGRRHGCHGRNYQDLWPPVLQPSGSWWGRQNWWVSVPIFSQWTHLMPAPASTGAGNISSLPSQLSLSTTTWVRICLTRLEKYSGPSFIAGVTCWNPSPAINKICKIVTFWFFTIQIHGTAS